MLKTEACGVCLTDLHATRGDWPVKPTPPFITGHEGIGRVFSVITGVTSVKEGDGVGVPWLYSACGHCEHACQPVSLSAWETVCGSAHGVLITAPSLAAFQQGAEVTRKRGTCVLTGLPSGEFPFPLFDVVLNCVTVCGSLVGTRQDMAEALGSASEGKVKAEVERQPLSAINHVLDRLERGEVAARVVLDFSAG